MSPQDNPKEKHANGIKGSIEGMIGTKTNLKVRKKNVVDAKREKFNKIISGMEMVNIRTSLLGTDFLIDMSEWDSTFYEIIDHLFSLIYSKDVIELIFFYLYERLNEDGSVNEIYDLENKVVPLQNVDDLWNLIQSIQVKEKTK